MEAVRDAIGAALSASAMIGAFQIWFQIPFNSVNLKLVASTGGVNLERILLPFRGL